MELNIKLFQSSSKDPGLSIPHTNIDDLNSNLVTSPFDISEEDKDIAKESVGDLIVNPFVYPRTAKAGFRSLVDTLAAQSTEIIGSNLRNSNSKSCECNYHFFCSSKATRLNSRLILESFVNIDFLPLWC